MCFFFTLTARESASSRVSEITKTFEQMKSVVTEGGGRPFITKWQGERGEVLEIPIVGQYQLVIKDESGKEVINEEVTIADEEHPYLFTPPADGLYTVEAGPQGVEYMRMTTGCTSKTSLLEVVQFGTVRWRSMHAMFRGCERMTFAPDIDTPDLCQVTGMSEMFRGCSAFNQPLEKWDVGNVTDMHWMFFGCSAFNQPLEGWNVGQVTNMCGMFYECRSFNQPLEGWNVENVEDMGCMFFGCSAFNQPLEAWNVENVEGMYSMFSGCSAFNQPLEAWNVESVEDMSGMFSGCSAFNQSLGAWDITNLPKDALLDIFTDCPAGALPFAQEWRGKGYEL